MLKPVDTLEITIVVDNVSDSLSSNPSFVETEFAGNWRRGMRSLSGKCLCCAAHGLSCLLTTRSGSETHTLLFDTGPDESLFERNIVRLGPDLGKVEAMVLSHGHFDHGGAMPRALQMMTMANGGKLVPTYMHPDMFAPRAIKTPDGRFMPMEDIPSRQVLEGNGAKLVVTREEQSVSGGSFYVSGEIPRVTSFERGMPGQHRMNSDGVWQLDELLLDERFIAVHIAHKGLFVFTACSHAGVINVLKQARARFPDVPVYGVLGGFHLAGGAEVFIPETVEALAEIGPGLIVPSHCTGWRAIGALAARFGDKVVPGAVGKRFVL